MDLTDFALSSFKAFNILFENEQAVFTPGDELVGKIFIHPIHTIQISPIKLSYKGYGTLCDQNEVLLETMKYWDKTIDLGINITELDGGQDHFIPFKETLPINLETSIESKSLTINYLIKARFTYRFDNNVFPLATIRGFTLIAPVYLDYLDMHYFKPTSYLATKKYGGFLCMAGHINLKIDIERTAYVSAENLVIEGVVENNSGKRVDNVIAILQKSWARYTSSSSKVVGSCEKPLLTTVSTEVINVKKENLAMYIDPHKQQKIARNFAVPTCRPSSFEMIHVNHHLVNVSYRLLIKVKQINEICGVSVPIFIGSVPHQAIHSKKNRWMQQGLEQSEEERRPHYQRDLSERPCSLFEQNETYLSKLNRMLHINHYQYYPYLSTSAKQAKQFRMLASAVRAENMFMAKLKNANEKKAADQQKADQQKLTMNKESTSFDPIQLQQKADQQKLTIRTKNQLLLIQFNFNK
ncbi:SWIM-type domain-containing protein [Aphelenchoides bicaudatus]|nr:SWIM-type domain-containing protein [Aphelenchoides bicaudatus]